MLAMVLKDLPIDVRHPPIVVEVAPDVKGRNGTSCGEASFMYLNFSTSRCKNIGVEYQLIICTHLISTSNTKIKEADGISSALCNSCAVEPVRGGAKPERAVHGRSCNLYL